MESLNLVVIGAGQAGLAVSRELKTRGIDHVVFERGRIGETWRGRWDSFCLVTPNWSVRLPGHPYDGSDPDGFMPRDEIVAYLQRYAGAVQAPVREGVAVRAISGRGDGGFTLDTSEGPVLARQLVLCTGAYQRPHRPEAAASLPQGLYAIDVDDYHNPQALPAGRVLVVGSGQSGCQLAEELHDAGRDVVLACGRAPWATRRIGDRDVVWWVIETGFWDAPLSSLTTPDARLFANVLATGHGGGHDMHLRTLQRMGVRLAGRFLGVLDGQVRFGSDLMETVAWGDQRYADFADLVRKTARQKALAVPQIEPPPPFENEPIECLPVEEFQAVLFAGGFRPDYGRWVHLPRAFDAMGFPLQQDGASTVVPGLYFAGVHFLRKRQSSLLYGVGEDAAIVAESVARRAAAAPTVA
ncbi:MAG TPA: NAD(P)-binding domain-containing protein [Candidatus Sulfotelmatobacter sp.]|nr:NAD(P)-binding domain-containing protein [Candidatus Sulfotelmatobacter sp.]